MRDLWPPTLRTRSRAPSATDKALLAAAEEMAAIGADAYAMEAAADAARQFLIEGRKDCSSESSRGARELFAADQEGEPPTIDGFETSSTRRNSRGAKHRLRRWLHADSPTRRSPSSSCFPCAPWRHTSTRAMQKRSVARREEL